MLKELSFRQLGSRNKEQNISLHKDILQLQKKEKKD